MLERRIKRRRLSAAGRPGYENDAVRKRHQMMEVGLRCFVEPELFEL